MEPAGAKTSMKGWTFSLPGNHLALREVTLLAGKSLRMLRRFNRACYLISTAGISAPVRSAKREVAGGALVFALAREQNQDSFQSFGLFHAKIFGSAFRAGEVASHKNSVASIALI